MKRGVIAVLISAVCFSTLGIFTKLLAGSLNSYAIVSFRLFFAVVFLSIFALLLKKKIRIKKTDLKFFIPYAFIGIFIAMTSLITAFYLTSVANVMFVLFLYPVITVIFGWMFLKEKITKVKASATLLGFIGIVIMFAAQNNLSLNSNDVVGLILSLIAAFCAAFYILMTRWSTRPFYTEAYCGMLFSLLFIIPVFFIVGEAGSFLVLGLNEWLLLIGIGLIGTVCAYLFLDYAEDYLEASRASLLNLSQAVVAVVLAFLILNEVPEIHTIVGGAFIILAGILALKG